MERRHQARLRLQENQTQGRKGSKVVEEQAVEEALRCSSKEVRLAVLLPSVRLLDEKGTSRASVGKARQEAYPEQDSRDTASSQRRSKAMRHERRARSKRSHRSFMPMELQGRKRTGRFERRKKRGVDVKDPKVVESFWSKVAKTGRDDCWLWKAAMTLGGYGNFRMARAHRVAFEISVGRQISIRKSIASGKTIYDVAREIGCSKAAVRWSATGRTWKHVPGALKIPKKTKRIKRWFRPPGSRATKAGGINKNMRTEKEVSRIIATARNNPRLSYVKLGRRHKRIRFLQSHQEYWLNSSASSFR